METSQGKLTFTETSGTVTKWKEKFNPLGHNSDHRQFSPNNIHMLPREIVMRINKMISKEKML